MRAWLAAHWAVVGLWVLFLSAVDFALMGVDKWKAKRDAWRIPELTLWAFALLGGAPGGYLDMALLPPQDAALVFQIWISCSGGPGPGRTGLAGAGVGPPIFPDFYRFAFRAGPGLT